MKKLKNFAPILFTVLILSFSQMSCLTVKQTAVACPEFSIKQDNKLISHHRELKKKETDSHKTKNKLLTFNNSRKYKKKEIVNKNIVPAVLNPIGRVSALNKAEYAKSLLASTDNLVSPGMKKLALSPLSKMNVSWYSDVPSDVQTTKCDTIIFRSGAKIIGKVEEIGQAEIKFRKCNNLSGPLISVPRSGVASIRYSNGTSDLLDPSDAYNYNTINPNTRNNLVQRTEGLGLAGFITSLVGLFVASIPLGIIAIVFGSISLAKIKRNPQAFRGKGFAKASLIIGIIDVVVMISLLALVL